MFVRRHLSFCDEEDANCDRCTYYSTTHRKVFAAVLLHSDSNWPRAAVGARAALACCHVASFRATGLLSVGSSRDRKLFA